jgi:hypothetical protein
MHFEDEEMGVLELDGLPQKLAHDSIRRHESICLDVYGRKVDETSECVGRRVEVG